MQSSCGGFSQAPLESFEGSCLGIVATKGQGLKMPRYSVQDKDGTIYISDMGGWGYGIGTIWAMTIQTNADGTKKTILKNLFPTKKLVMPNGLLLDPEGRLYVGTSIGVFRFDPKNEKQEFNIDAELETIEDGFMQSIFRKTEYANSKAYNAMARNLKNRHPLIQLAANKDFTEIYLNVGAPSDRCDAGLKITNDQGLCAQSESSLINAGIWKVNLSNDSSRKKLSTEGFARGLRNSMGLAVHPYTQKLFQAENSMDLTDDKYPFEEINLVEQGKHYGWPYCHSNGMVNDAFKKVVTSKDCLTKYANPVINLPAHSAPLSLLFYSGKMFPDLKNRLLVSLHGYRPTGQKIVSFDIDEKASVTSDAVNMLVHNWTPKKAFRPLGAPVGLTELNDGSILVIDDKNATVLLWHSGVAYQEDSSDLTLGKTQILSSTQIESMKKMMPIFQKNCTACHAEFSSKDPADLIKKLDDRGMLDIDDPQNSLIIKKIETKDMPRGAALPAADYQNILKLLKTFPASPQK